MRLPLFLLCTLYLCGQTNLTTPVRVLPPANHSDSGELRILDKNGVRYISVRPPLTIPGNVNYRLPGADGSTGSALTTNGSGTLSWTPFASDVTGVCDGTTDDQPAIQEALNALGSGGGVVKLPPGRDCRINSTVTIPASYTTFDCQGSKLTYTHSTGDAILVSPFASDVPYLSGSIRNCWIQEGTGTPVASNGIHMQSRLGFAYYSIRIKGFNGIAGSCMYWENTVAMPQFTEQNAIFSMDTFDCSRGLKFVNSSGTNSFMYNYIANWHCGILDGQYCLSLEGDGTPNNILMFGSYLDLRVNGNGSTAMRVVSATGGSIIERKTVNITGELTTGTGPFYSLYADASSEIFVNGNVNVTGSQTFSGGVQSIVAVVPQADPSTESFLWQAGGGILPERHCKYTLGYPSTLTGNGGDATFWLASYGGVENNCHFQLLARDTDPGNKDVNITGSGPAPVNVLYADGLSKSVGIGPSFSDSFRPAYNLDLLGGTFRTPDTIRCGNTLGCHTTYAGANSDESFVLLIGAGASTATKFFSVPFGSTPSCVATPNTTLVSFGAVVGGWAIAPSSTSVTVNQWAVLLSSGASTTFGFAVTYFVRCTANPN